jgi:hypothetical protein
MFAQVTGVARSDHEIGTGTLTIRFCGDLVVMDLSPQDLEQLARIERDVLREWRSNAPVPLNDRVTRLVDRLLDAGRRDEARILYDAMATIRSIYLGTPQGMDLAGALRLLSEAATRIQVAAADSR